LRLIFLLLCLLTTSTTFSQKGQQIPSVSGLLYSIETEEDIVQFIKLDSTTTIKKPVFVMLQGSLPIPLIIRDSAQSHLTSFPYSYKEITEDYHIINISMPHLPILVSPSEINANGSLKAPPALYNKNNYLQNYVDRTKAVLDFVILQPWADTTEVIMLGHSQGAYVAIKVANDHNAVTAVGLSGFSPFGRYDQHIRKMRIQEHQGILSSDEAQSAINEYYDRWDYYVDHQEDDNQVVGDTPKATVSFSENFMDDLMDISIPMYIMYGSRDIGAIGCDYLPIEFERVHKDNYQISVFPGLGHNFEEVDGNGRSNYENMYWQKAIDSYIDWAAGIKKMAVKDKS